MIRFDVEGESTGYEQQVDASSIGGGPSLTSCQSASGAVIYRNQSLALAAKGGTNGPQIDRNSAYLPTWGPATGCTRTGGFSSCLHFLEANHERYLSYQEAHPDLNEWDIVTQVNIGLDHPFYTNIQTVSDPNSLLVLCNKYWKLPDGYEPSDLRKLSFQGCCGVGNQMRSEAADAFEQTLCGC